MRTRLERWWQPIRGKEGSERWRVPVLYAIWAAFWFIFFLVATFSHEQALEGFFARKLAGTARVDLERVTFSFPFGYAVRQASLVLPAGGDRAVVEATDLSIKPTLSALARLRLTPALLRAQVAGGMIESRWELRSNRLASEVTISDLDLARWRGVEHWLEGSIAGILNGHLQIEVTLPGLTRNSGSAEIHLAQASITNGVLGGAGLKIPDLHFRQIALRATIDNGRFQLAEGTAAGEELTAAAQGVLTLANPLALSALNVDLKLSPSSRAPAGLSLLLGMLPAPEGSRAAGERRLRIFGTLAHPRAAAS